MPLDVTKRTVPPARTSHCHRFLPHRAVPRTQQGRWSKSLCCRLAVNAFARRMIHDACAGVRLKSRQKSPPWSCPRDITRKSVNWTLPEYAPQLLATQQPIARTRGQRKPGIMAASMSQWKPRWAVYSRCFHEYIHRQRSRKACLQVPSPATPVRHFVPCSRCRSLFLGVESAHDLYTQ